MAANGSFTRVIKPRYARNAFTLIELLIVMMVIAIVSAAGAPKFADSITRFRIEAVVQRIAGDLKHARRSAQQTSSAVTVSFDVTNNEYILSGVADIDRRGQVFSFSLAETEYDCELVSATFGSSSTVTFNVHGQPDNGGSIVVRCGTEMRTIAVSTLGQVSSS
jgi:prepilin-type N-terminal cleavage/methylation domain-containing protein